MTEKYWQERKHFNNINDKNLNPVLKKTFDDKKENVPVKHFKERYWECLRGSLDIKSWERSDDLSVDDMGMLACRDVGCELNYCQTSMTDPYESPFENCDGQQKEFYGCIQREIRMYNYNSHGRSLQDHLKLRLEEKKKNKYSHIFPELATKKDVIIEQKYISMKQAVKIPNKDDILKLNEKL